VAFARSPLVGILALLFVVRVVGIGWGLPASDGWDNDGVAPRDFLAGLVETVMPGHFYTYPPVHLALLACVTAPVTIVALARSQSLAATDVIHEIVKVPYMTVIAYAARFLSLLMSLGIVWAVAKITEELRGRRAGLCAAALVGVNVPLTYYAHTTNLDVPYLFWGSLALLALVRAIARREPIRLRRWAVLAAIAVATKDQAYALFLISVPVALALWVCVDPWARSHARLVVREGLRATAVSIAILFAMDGPLFNPMGFARRVRFLLGPASQAFAQYTNDWLGRWDVLRDLVTRFDSFYPVVFALPMAVGALVLLRGARGEQAKLAAGQVPLFALISFTVAFNCVARRTDERFALPQTVLAAIYGGIGVDALLSRVRLAAARWAVRASATAALGAGLFAALSVDANLLFDPRYDAEAWLREHVRPGDLVETYGLNVYLPRFPSAARVIRVGPESDHRSPMPGVDEVTAAYGDMASRGARYVVFSEGWAWRYLLDPDGFPSHGHMLPPTQRETGNDRAATSYFRALTRDQYVPYHLAYTARWQSETWEPIEIHASTSRAIWIYEHRPLRPHHLAERP
jgi:hypothetical protein